MSEASIGNRSEQIAIGFACQRNRAHASGQVPTEAIKKLAEDIGLFLTSVLRMPYFQIFFLVKGLIADPTNGADHWYSPRSMPMEDEAYKCKPQGLFDCGGGLEQVQGLPKKNYKPRWADEKKKVVIPGVREAYFKFYAIGGATALQVCSK